METANRGAFGPDAFKSFSLPAPIKWSYSSWSLFDLCPKKYQELRVLKNYKEADTEQILYGNRVHKAFELRLRENKPFDPEFSHFEETAKTLISLGGRRWCELKIGLTKDLEPCKFFANDVWWRGVIDLLIIPKDRKPVAFLFDYKTGKSRYASVEQLELMALATFKHFPSIKKVNSALIFLTENKPVPSSYALSDASDLWLNWFVRLGTLEAAHKSNVWNAKPNFSCRKWCPVLSCPHNGRG
jgi:hypothetical protein